MALLWPPPESPEASRKLGSSIGGCAMALHKWLVGLVGVVGVVGVLGGNQEAGAESIPSVVDTQVNPANGRTYHLLSRSTWTDAEATAVSLGGHLATINDHPEELWVWDTFSGYNVRLLWIGLNDIAVEGTFVWTSGEPLTYTNWAPSQPLDHHFAGPEDYVQMGYSGNDYRWNDLANIDYWQMPVQGVVEIVPDTNPIPAPSTLVGLLSMGLVGLVIGLRRRFRKAA